MCIRDRSYTEFAYSNLQLSAPALQDGQTVTVSVDVTNTGKVAGREVVQLYVRDKNGTPERPSKELRGFAKVLLEPGAVSYTHLVTIFPL